MSTHWTRLSLLPALFALLVLPAAATAQIDIRVGNSGRFFVPLPAGADDQPPPVLRFLGEGTSLHAESASPVTVVLFVARTSKGKVVSTAETAPFRLDAKAASTSSGMLLGSAVTKDQLMALRPVRSLAKAIVLDIAQPGQPVYAARLVEDPAGVFAALQGAFMENDALIIAAIPADATLRRQAAVRPMALFPASDAASK